MSDRTSPLVSEEIEPFAMKVIGRFVMLCEKAEDGHDLHRACDRFWYAANALNHLATACDAPHFTIAMSNEMSRIAEYIEVKTGVRPEWLEHKPYLPIGDMVPDAGGDHDEPPIPSP